MTHVTSPHDDFLVVTIEIDEFDMKLFLVDIGSSTNILFLDTFESMRNNKKELKPVEFL